MPGDRQSAPPRGGYRQVLKTLLLPAAAALSVAAATQHLTSAAAAATGPVLPAPGGTAADGEEAIRLGAAAYTQLVRESLEDGEARGCWEQVGEQLRLLQQQPHEDACSSRGEAFRELIALTRVRCIYTRSRRPFPGPKEGCYLFPHEVPQEWLELQGPKDPAGSEAAAAIGAPPQAAQHPCVQLRGVLQQLQQLRQLQQLQEYEWENVDEITAEAKQQERQQEQQHGEGGGAVDTDGDRGAPAAQETKSVGVVYSSTQQQVVQLRKLQQLQQQLRRSCAAVTQRQAVSCQQHGKMEFGTFALVREQINHIERQRRTEAAAAKLSAASTAAANRMQEQLRHLEQMEQLQQKLQLQQLQGGSYMQQLLQQLQQGMEDSFAVLQQLKAFHQAVAAWVGGTETLVIYSAAALAALVLTSSSRVAAARLWLMGCICASAAAEVALHHGGLSPYLLQLTQQLQKQKPAKSAAAAAASGWGTTERLLEQFLAELGAAGASAVAVYGVSFVRWACLLACCWMWLQCLLRYTSPEQLLQQQLQQLQQQVSGVRSELQQAQQEGDPRMQEVQQLLQQLLHCVVAKDADMQRLRQQQQEQQQQQQDAQDSSKQEEQQQPMNASCKRIPVLGWIFACACWLVAAIASALFPAVIAAAAGTWRYFVVSFRVLYSILCWRRETKFTQPQRVATKVVSPTPSCTKTVWWNQQQKQRGCILPEGLRRQSRRYNADEGEEVDPTYQPTPQSTSSSASAAVTADAAADVHSDDNGAVPPQQQQQEPKQQQKPRQGQQLKEQQQTKQQQGPPRRNPPRKCRVDNYKRIEDPQHPDAFMREVVAPERLKALQEPPSPSSTESSSSSSTSLTDRSSGPSPAATPAAATPLQKGAAARAHTTGVRLKRTPMKEKQQQQQQLPQQQQQKQQQHGVSPASENSGGREKVTK